MLKQLLIVIALFATIGNLFGQGSVVGNVEKTPVPIVVDGTPDNAWDQVLGFRMNVTLVRQMGITQPTSGGRAKLLYDNNNLYILLVVEDDAFVKDSQYGVTHGNDDGFDIPLGFGVLNSEDHAAHAPDFVRLDVGMDVDSVVPTLVGWQGNFFSDIDESKIDAAIKRTSVGANIEMTIPWSEIGMPSGGFTGNDTMLFDARYNDDDGNYDDPMWPGTSLRETQISCGSHNPMGVNWWWEKPYYCSKVVLVNSTIMTDVEDDLYAQVKIYPNPASDFLKLENVKRGTQIQVFNLIGKTMISTTANGMNMKLDVSDLHTGIYFVKIGNGFTQRIVID